MSFRTAFLAALLAAPLPAQAQDPLDGVVSHRVLPGWQQADGTYMAGLEIALAPGWKTYWRSPGDAGIPPLFSWSEARNVDQVHVHWPSPGIFHEAGMRSIGYTQTVILPLTIAANHSDQEMHLRGEMALGVCSDICVPARLEIDTTLPAGAGARTPQIVAALASLPYSAQDAGVRDAVCRMAPAPDGLTIEAQIAMPSAGGAEAAVIEPGAPGIWVSEAETTRHGGTLTISADMMHHSDTSFVLDRSEIRITVIGSAYSVDIKGCTGG